MTDPSSGASAGAARRTVTVDVLLHRVEWVATVDEGDGGAGAAAGAAGYDAAAGAGAGAGGDDGLCIPRRPLVALRLLDLPPVCVRRTHTDTAAHGDPAHGIAFERGKSLTLAVPTGKLPAFPLAVSLLDATNETTGRVLAHGSVDLNQLLEVAAPVSRGQVDLPLYSSTNVHVATAVASLRLTAQHTVPQQPRRREPQPTLAVLNQPTPPGSPTHIVQAPVVASPVPTPVPTAEPAPEPAGELEALPTTAHQTDEFDSHNVWCPMPVHIVRPAVEAKKPTRPEGPYGNPKPVTKLTDEEVKQLLHRLNPPRVACGATHHRPSSPDTSVGTLKSSAPQLSILDQLIQELQSLRGAGQAVGTCSQCCGKHTVASAIQAHPPVQDTAVQTWPATSTDAEPETRSPASSPETAMRSPRPRPATTSKSSIPVRKPDRSATRPTDNDGLTVAHVHVSEQFPASSVEGRLLYGQLKPQQKPVSKWRAGQHPMPLPTPSPRQKQSYNDNATSPRIRQTRSEQLRVAAIQRHRSAVAQRDAENQEYQDRFTGRLRSAPVAEPVHDAPSPTHRAVQSRVQSLEHVWRGKPSIVPNFTPTAAAPFTTVSTTGFDLNSMTSFGNSRYAAVEDSTRSDVRASGADMLYDADSHRVPSTSVSQAPEKMAPVSMAPSRPTPLPVASMAVPAPLAAPSPAHAPSTTTGPYNFAHVVAVPQAPITYSQDEEDDDEEHGEEQSPNDTGYTPGGYSQDPDHEGHDNGDDDEEEDDYGYEDDTFYQDEEHSHSRRDRYEDDDDMEHSRV